MSAEKTLIDPDEEISQKPGVKLSFFNDCSRLEFKKLLWKH
jgi:hypothetical protein